jgi:hypothetical protein
VATELVVERLSDLRATGYERRDLVLLEGENFRDIHRDVELPLFYWLDVTARAGSSDLGVDSLGRLVVSQRVKDLLDALGIQHCDVREWLD